MIHVSWMNLLEEVSLVTMLSKNYVKIKLYMIEDWYIDFRTSLVLSYLKSDQNKT